MTYYRLDPGSILVNGFLLSKARRPNASVERDKSRSTTLREHISFGFDLSSSWEIRILWALARYVQIGELCPKVDITSVTVLCRNKAQQPCSDPHQRPRCESQSSKSNKRQQVQVTTYKLVSSQQANDHRTVSPLLYSPPPSQLTSTEPRTGSGRPALQPPRVTGRSQSEDTNRPVCHRTYTARRRRP